MYCDAVVEREPELVCDVMMGVGWRMSGAKLDESARPFVEAMRVEKNRVVLRCTPYATFGQPPRHLHRNDQDEQVTHWLSGTVPWSATDPA